MRNRQAITLLFISNIISGFAQGISMIAIPWYFIHDLDQAGLFGRFYLFITFLILFWGVYAGTIIDRYSRKKIFIYTNLVCGTIILLISIYGYLFSIVPSYLILLVFGLTIFNYNIHYPNLYAFAQEITEKDYYGKLNSYIEVQGQVTSMVSGAFAAMLLHGINDNYISLGGFSFPVSFNIEAWSIHEVFLMDAITYFVGIFLFIFIRYKPIITKDIHIGSLVERIRGGIHYLKNNPSIFRFGTLTYMLFAFTLVEVHVLLPGYVERFLRSSVDVYASAEIYYSIGAILSGFLIYRVLSRYNVYLNIIMLMIFVSFAFFAISFSDNLMLFFMTNLLLGITNAGVRILRTTYLFSNIPNNLIGRSTSVFSSINVMVRMLLILLFSLPFFLEDDNIRWGYFCGAIMLICSALLLYLSYQRDR